MIFLKDEEEEGLCPYCYAGTLAQDPHTKRIFCKVCKYAIKINYATMNINPAVSLEEE